MGGASRIRYIVRFAAPALALLLATEQVCVQEGTSAVGGDFVPVRAAAQALLHGASVYTDPSFVYPPTAAIGFLPTALGTPAQSYAIWLGLLALALLGAAVLVGSAGGPRSTLATSAAVLVLLGGCTAEDALSTGNVSVLLVPVAVGCVIAFHRERWLLGTALLVGSLLFKPLLAPLVIVPVLRRRWRELGTVLVPALLLAAAGGLAVPGGRNLPRILVYCLRGTNLHGANAQNNLSIRGWVSAHHLPPTIGTLAAILVAIVAVWRWAFLRKSISPAGTASLAFATTLLVAAASEDHYLLVLAALTLTQTRLEPGRPLRGSWILGWCLLAIPPGLSVTASNSLGRETWYLVAEACFYFGALTLGSTATRARDPLCA
jgi:hypothetical protein